MFNWIARYIDSYIYQNIFSFFLPLWNKNELEAHFNIEKGSLCPASPYGTLGGYEANKPHFFAENPRFMPLQGSTQPARMADRKTCVHPKKIWPFGEWWMSQHAALTAIRRKAFL